MAVYEINGGKMLRITRSVDGVNKQTYISLIGKNKKSQAQARKEARALDAKWAAQQDKARKDRYRKAETPRGHPTGIKGINVVFRPHLAYRVQAMTGGQHTVREFSTKRLGTAAAWQEAKKCLASARGLSRVPNNWRKTPPRPKKPA